MGWWGGGGAGKGGWRDSIFFTCSPLSYGLKGYFHPLPNNLKGILYFVEGKHTHVVGAWDLQSRQRHCKTTTFGNTCIRAPNLCVSTLVRMRPSNMKSGRSCKGKHTKRCYRNLSFFQPSEFLNANSVLL